jgi:hypothetical protein
MDEAYGLPENFLEVEVLNPKTHADPTGKPSHTDYEVTVNVIIRKRNFRLICRLLK